MKNRFYAEILINHGDNRFVRARPDNWSPPVNIASPFNVGAPSSSAPLTNRSTAWSGVEEVVLMNNWKYALH